MSNDAITVGSKTTTGGEVTTGSSGILVNGQPLACIGDKATCKCGQKNCKGIGPIVATSPRPISHNGKLLARPSDLVDTGCGTCFLLTGVHAVSINTETASTIKMGSGIKIGNGIVFGGLPPGGSSLPATRLTQQNTRTVAANISNSTPPPTIDPKNAYWPPYNFLAKEGEKEVHVSYTQDVVETTVLSPEEWREFFDMIDKTQNIGGAITGTYNAFDTAKNLGGLGVIAYVKTYNGVDYIILKGYKQHMKTLLAGNRFKASNPQVVKLGLGSLHSVKGMTRYVKIAAPMEILVGSAINVLQYVLNDEYTLRQLGIDEAKLLVNVLAVAGTALIIGTVVVPTTILASGVVLVLSSLLVWGADQKTQFQSKLIESVLRSFDEN